MTQTIRCSEHTAKRLGRYVTPGRRYDESDTVPVGDGLVEFPVDDEVYNRLTELQSKLNEPDIETLLVKLMTHWDRGETP